MIVPTNVRMSFILSPEQQKQKTDLNSLDEKLTQYNENVIQSLHVVKEVQKKLILYNDINQKVTRKHCAQSNLEKLLPYQFKKNEMFFWGFESGAYPKP